MYMSLISEKKSVEQKYQKIASMIILVIGIIFLLWFVFHLLVASLIGSDYNFLSVISMIRILLGLIFAGSGYAMYKFVDFDYETPRPVD